MAHSRRRWSLMVIAALLLSSLAWSHNSLHAAPASPVDEAVVRALVLRFFSTYAQKDVDGFMSLWMTPWSCA